MKVSSWPGVNVFDVVIMFVYLSAQQPSAIFFDCLKKNTEITTSAGGNELFWTTPEEGHPRKIVGVWGPLPKTLTLFYDQNLRFSLPYLSPG